MTNVLTLLLASNFVPHVDNWLGIGEGKREKKQNKNQSVKCLLKTNSLCTNVLNTGA